MRNIIIIIALIINPRGGSMMFIHRMTHAGMSAPSHTIIIGAAGRF